MRGRTLNEKVLRNGRRVSVRTIYQKPQHPHFILCPADGVLGSCAPPRYCRFRVSQAAAEGIVVDSSVVQGKGGVADVLVSWGKLKVGDVIVAGLEYGKVRG